MKSRLSRPVKGILFLTLTLGLMVGLKPATKLAVPHPFVDVKVGYNNGHCKADGKTYPIHVQTTNRSLRTVTKVSVMVAVRHPGHSDKLNSDEWLGDDKILKPGESTHLCWGLPSVKNEDYSKLEYEIQDTAKSF